MIHFNYQRIYQEERHTLLFQKKTSVDILLHPFFLVRPRIKPEQLPARCRPFTDFALKTAFRKDKKYAPRWGLKRCKAGRVIKKRIDPRVEWPRVADFMARFRLPPQCVQELTDEFEASPFRPGKGKHETRGSPIPLFHKV